MSQSVGGIPIRRGALAGAAAFVAVAAIMHLFVRTGTLVNEFLARLVSDAPITITLGAVLDAHAWFVQTQVGDSPALMVVPVLALVIAGFVTARGTEIASPVTGFTHGASVVAGYLALLVVFIVLMQLFGTTGESGTSTEQLFQVAITGVVYPIVVGGIGGLLAGLVGGSGARAGVAAN